MPVCRCRRKFRRTESQRPLSWPWWHPCRARYRNACARSASRRRARAQCPLRGCRRRPSSRLAAAARQWGSRPVGPLGLAGDGKGLACPLRGDVVEASTVAVEHRLLAFTLQVHYRPAMPVWFLLGVALTDGLGAYAGDLKSAVREGMRARGQILYAAGETCSVSLPLAKS